MEKCDESSSAEMNSQENRDLVNENSAQTSENAASNTTNFTTNMSENSTKMSEIESDEAAAETSTVNSCEDTASAENSDEISSPPIVNNSNGTNDDVDNSVKNGENGQNIENTADVAQSENSNAKENEDSSKKNNDDDLDNDENNETDIDGEGSDVENSSSKCPIEIAAKFEKETIRESEESQRMDSLTSELSGTSLIPQKPRRMSTGQLALAKTTYHQFSARRASEDSLLDGAGKDLKTQLSELDEKYKKAMLTNAQLDNEKQMFKYQVENLKDTIEDLEELSTETQRQYKEKSRDYEFEKRTKRDLERENQCLKEQIKKRDALIAEHGLVIVGKDEIMTKDGFKIVSDATLLSAETAQFLEAGEGSLDDRLKVFVEEKKDLEEEVRRLRQELENTKETKELASKYGPLENSPRINGPDVMDIQREASRQVSDYEFKLSKAEADIASLESNVSRLEGQVKRYKTDAEEAERVEEELKTEKRKLARELRESQTLIEELQSQNGHLQKRLEKLKSSRNQLLK